MKHLLSVSLLCLLIFNLCSCQFRSQVPKPTAYKFSTQQKMQAAHHWDILAKDVADRIDSKLKSLESNEFLTPLFINHNTDSPFEKAFRNLLLSHITNYNYQVSDNKSENLQIDFDVQIIHHKSNRKQRNWPGFYTTAASIISGGVAVARNITDSASGYAAATGGILTGAMLDYSKGYHVEMPNNEIIVTTKAKKYSRILFHYTDIYYINDDDTFNYSSTRKGKTYNVK